MIHVMKKVACDGTDPAMILTTPKMSPGFLMMAEICVRTEPATTVDRNTAKI
jgi:hypothetical protein